MDDLLELDETPAAKETYMIAGWRQWADAGSTSSLLPQYIIERLGARRIGRIKSEPFYLFQFPGTHHLLRPEIKLEEGYRKRLDRRKNEIYYAGDENIGLVILTGDEPHLSADRYAEVFFNIAQELDVKRIAAVGGVYASVPYNRDRQITCTYSLPRMKEELARYAVGFSDYEGGVSIGSFLGDRAEALEIEYFVFYAMVPMYDFSELSPLLQGITVEEDYKAWHDVMRRLSHMFKLGFDLADLEAKSKALVVSMDAQIAKLKEKMPQVDIAEYMGKISDSFVEPSFMPLDDVWETGLDDILKDLE